MRHGSLFSGIGGFDLAAEWVGWENKFHCEWNPFGQRVLKHYWPNAESFNDITKTDFKKYANKIDILTGGFPCQPYSSAGKRLGKEDERHLWPEMLRAIREISPRFVVGENVRGLTNWNGGMVFDEVCAELENLGYQVAPVIIPACAVGAPHKRERIWFVAQNTMRSGCVQRESIEKGAEVWQQRNTSTGSSDRVYISEGITANTNSYRLERGIPSIIYREKSSSKAHDEKCISAYKRALSFEEFPTQSPVCGGNDGFSDRLDGVAFSKWRAESIKAYGNAIVPQVAYEIFKAIQLTNENTGH
jgi:DNA (cytosine-5)-methyltransferase 1